MTRLAIVLIVACGAEAAPTTPQPTPEPEAAPAPEAAPEAEPAPDSDDHLRCERDEQCVAASGLCGSPVGVRREHLEEFLRRQRESPRLIECGIPEPTFGDPVAYCWEGWCAAADSALRCASTDECIEVEGACGMHAVVHRDFQRRVSDHFDRLASVSTCPGDRRAPEVTTECRRGVCVGDVVEATD